MVFVKISIYFDVFLGNLFFEFKQFIYKLQNSRLYFIEELIWDVLGKVLIYLYEFVICFKLKNELYGFSVFLFVFILYVFFYRVYILLYIQVFYVVF